MTPDSARAIFASGEEKTVEVLLAQAAENALLHAEMERLLVGIRGVGHRFCAGCFEKQQKIDRLQGEVANLRQKLRYREKKAQEGYFGSSTPSSKKPIKPNSGAGKQKRKSGAKAGHKGYGRKGFTPETADRVIRVPVPGLSLCGEETADLGTKRRSVLDLPPIQTEKLLYLLERRRGVSTGKEYRARAPGVLPGWLYGNSLVSQAAVMHYVHGIPMGTIERMLRLPRCSLIDTFHGLSTMFESILPKLTAEYRMASVKHADETGWRSQGQSGYAWIFHCENVNLFLFRQTRSGEVPAAVFGESRVPGVLVVDRYKGYNRVPCKVQFCYEHLKRNLQDLVKKYPDSSELKRFADHVVPLLRKAIKLRGRPISDAQFYQKAEALKSEIIAAMEADAHDEAIRTYQDIFRDHEARMYHWADDRQVPAHNNTAERELRPTVIARKVSFGSQSDKGRKTREVLASVLNTLALRGSDPAAIFKAALDRLAVDKKLDRYTLLFGKPPPAAVVEAHTQCDAPQQPQPPPDTDTSTGQSHLPRHRSHKTTLRTAAAAVALLIAIFLAPLVFHLPGVADPSPQLHSNNTPVSEILSTDAISNTDETVCSNSPPSHGPGSSRPPPHRSRPPPLGSPEPVAHSP